MVAVELHEGCPVDRDTRDGAHGEQHAAGIPYGFDIRGQEYEQCDTGNRHFKEDSTEATQTALPTVRVEPHAGDIDEWNRGKKHPTQSRGMDSASVLDGKSSMTDFMHGLQEYPGGEPPKQTVCHEKFLRIRPNRIPIPDRSDGGDQPQR